MASNILYLTPVDVAATPSAEALEAALRAAKFIDEDFSFEGKRHYRPGEQFLQQVTFLGCSPVVSLGMPGLTGDEFCHIEIEQFQAPVLVAGANAKVPRCRSCRARNDEWRPNTHSAWEPDEQRHCPACGTQATAVDVDWRQCAGVGRFFIKVWGVFEGEAVPGDELLNVLLQATGTAWHYFYWRG